MSNRARYVTYAQLKRKGACSTYLDLFGALFGTKGRVKVTTDATFALSQTFNWDWAVASLLTPRQQKVYEAGLDLDLKGPRADRDARSKIFTKHEDALGRDAGLLHYAHRVAFSNSYREMQARNFALAYNTPK
jgi:hypothetical protein